MQRFYVKKYKKHNKTINELIGDIYDARMKTWLIKNHKKKWKQKYFDEDPDYFDLEAITNLATNQYDKDQSTDTELDSISTDPLNTWKERKKEVEESSDLIEWL